MSNFRVYYPVENIAIGPYCSHTGTQVHGLQSATMNTSFNLDRVFELGQLDIYQNIENLPVIDMTLEKVIDGYPLLYHLASQGATSSDLANRSNQRADVFLSIFSDAQVSASGTPLVQVYCSGMYLNSVSYRLPVDGNLTENVSLVGNDKIWATSNFAFNGSFDDTDVPASGVKRRQNVVFDNGGSIFPQSIPGVSASGYNVQTAGQFGAHIQDITVTANIGRTDLYELGRRRPYYKYANFPVAVETSINVTAGGASPGDMVNAVGDNVNNLSDEQIVIKIDDGTRIDLGTHNKLQSVNFNAGNTGGGVATITYSYLNYNHLVVTSPSDPMGL